MIALSQDDILFDDFSLLVQTISRKELIAAAVNANCDCVGYTSPANDHVTDTPQSAAVAGQKN